MRTSVSTRSTNARRGTHSQSFCPLAPTGPKSLVYPTPTPMFYDVSTTTVFPFSLCTVLSPVSFKIFLFRLQ